MALTTDCSDSCSLYAGARPVWGFGCKLAASTLMTSPMLTRRLDYASTAALVAKQDCALLKRAAHHKLPQLLVWI